MTRLAQVFGNTFGLTKLLKYDKLPCLGIVIVTIVSPRNILRWASLSAGRLVSAVICQLWLRGLTYLTSLV